MINSAEHYIQLLDSDEEEVYSQAYWDEASDETWLAIIKDHPDYQIYVVRNETISDNIFIALSKSENWVVRTWVAMKRKIPKELFPILAWDEEGAVRSEIAANKKTPIEIVEQLVADEDESVVRVAKYNLEEYRQKQEKKLKNTQQEKIEP